jgi:hypothetical protein
VVHSPGGVCFGCLGGKNSTCYNCFFSCPAEGVNLPTKGTITLQESFLAFSSLHSHNLPVIDLKSLTSVPKKKVNQVRKFDGNKDGFLTYREFVEYNMDSILNLGDEEFDFKEL